MLKVLHTSDWHLGKKLYKESRLKEQKLFIQYILEASRENNIDIFIIAGDIFDVPNPPNDAYKLYNDFLHEIQKICKHIIIISGNHDSGSFLKATDSLIDQKRVHIADKLYQRKEDNIITITIEDTKINFFCLPYFRTYQLHQYKEYNNISYTNDELWGVDTLRHFFKTNHNELNFLISHHAFGNYSASGSEHTLTLSGLNSIPLDTLFGFDYCALGHIHQYQQMAQKEIYYTGSPIKMRFSENSKKYFNIIDVENKDYININKIQIPIFRDVIQIKTDTENYIDDLKDKFKTIESKELSTLVEVVLKVNQSVTGISETIKSICDQFDKQLLNIIPLLESSEFTEEMTLNIHEMSPFELLSKFYQELYPEETLPKHLTEKFNLLMKEIQSES